MYLESGLLKMSVESGLVWRTLEDVDEPEPLGHIEEELDYPPDTADDWEYLLIEWRDRCSFGDACRAEPHAVWRMSRWEPSRN